MRERRDRPPHPYDTLDGDGNGVLPFVDSRNDHRRTDAAMRRLPKGRIAIELPTITSIRDADGQRMTRRRDYACGR